MKITPGLNDTSAAFYHESLSSQLGIWNWPVVVSNISVEGEEYMQRNLNFKLNLNWSSLPAEFVSRVEWSQ